MAQGQIEVGNISDISGEVNIAGGNIGFTAKQVSIILKQITSTFQPKPFDGRCPYKGLDVFEEEDAELFFGRERLVDDLVSRVKESRTVFITGPSGSGKSSLVRAGLIHALRDGTIKDLHSEHWLYEIIKPGREPLEALASAFSRLKSPDLANYFREHTGKANILNECAESALSGQGSQRLVLFFDQFEEVFTQISRDKTEKFLSLLTDAVAIENGRAIILFAMRSEFIPNCATYSKLNELLNQNFIQITAMQPGELVSAIAQPALRVGLKIDPDLIAQIINDMQGEPGALPLMQFALKDLFDVEQAKSGIIALTLNDYLQRGGIRKSLERHADDSFAKLNQNEQELARSIFGGLIEPGQGTVDTRRTALFDELIPINAKAEDVKAIIQKLADARLITTDEQAGQETVTISHEKLIEAWPWLKKLVDENRDIIAFKNEIANDAKEWEEHKRDPSYLYVGARLANAREQMAARRLSLSGLAQEFVQKGNTRQRRGQMALISGVSIILVLLSLGMIVFRNQAYANANLAQRNEEIANTAQAASTFAVAQEAIAQANAAEAQTQSSIARAGELAAMAISQQNNNFDLALLLGIEALQTDENLRTKITLLNLIKEKPHLTRYLFSNQGTNNQTINRGLAISPDGKILASSDCEYFLDLKDNRICAQGVIILWNIDNPTNPIKLTTLHGYKDRIISLAFSPDSKHLASGNGNGTIILWDISNIANPTKLIILTEHNEGVVSLAFSPDGKILASGGFDNSIIIWDVSKPVQPSKLNTLSGHTSSVYSIAFNPNGTTLASGSRDGTMILWDMNNLNSPSKLVTLAAHSNWVSSVAFSPDGKILASGGGDNNIIIWDVSNRNQPIKISTLTDPSSSFAPGRSVVGAGFDLVAFSPDGTMLASGRTDHAIELWDVRSPKKPVQISILTGHSAHVSRIVFSPNSKKLISQSSDSTIIFWEISDPADDLGVLEPTISILTIPNGIVSSISFSPDRNLLATGGSTFTFAEGTEDTNKTTFFPIQDGETNVNSSSHDQNLSTSESSYLVVNTVQGDITLWNVTDPSKPSKHSVLPVQNGGVYAVSFGPDGNSLATIGCDKLDGNDCSQREISLWDISNPSDPTKTSTLPDQISDWHEVGRYDEIAFSPHAKLLAALSCNKLDGEVCNQKQIALWNVSNLSNPVQFSILPNQNGELYGLAFSPDGKLLATIGEEIVLWNVSNPSNPTKCSIVIDKDTDVGSVAISPNDNLFAAASEGGIGLWNISDPEKPTLFQILPLQEQSEIPLYAAARVAFSPDGKTLYVLAEDFIFLWDISDPYNPNYVSMLSEIKGWIESFTFGLNGKLLVTAASNGTISEIIFWDLDTQSWIQTTCRRVGRNFARVEWAKYFPSEEYRATCPQWPLEPEVTPTPSPTP